jgi:hypothetical protein
MIPINKCLNRQLVEICSQVNRLQKTQVKIEQYLPVHLLAHCRVASFNKGSLHLVVDDAVWASELRYLIPALRDKLRAEGGLHQLVAIKLKVQHERIQQKPLNLPRHISEKTKEMLTTQALECDYLPLREAIAKLARNNVDGQIR